MPTKRQRKNNKKYVGPSYIISLEIVCNTHIIIMYKTESTMSLYICIYETGFLLQQPTISYTFFIISEAIIHQHKIEKIPMRTYGYTDDT